MTGFIRKSNHENEATRAINERKAQDDVKVSDTDNRLSFEQRRAANAEAQQ